VGSQLVAVTDLPKDIRDRYEVHEWHHAVAILKADYPKEWQDILAVLRGFNLWRSQVLAPGGAKSLVAVALDGPFYDRGWEEKQFKSKLDIDGVEHNNPTHKIDCYRNQVALEVEWSNKDPFYDRDLNNFRILFDLRAISVGVIITKSEDLKELFKGLTRKNRSGKEVSVYSKYGASTTWMGKLLPRIEGGGGGGCPILVFGIGERTYVEDAENEHVTPELIARAKAKEKQESEDDEN
jgi:Restriction endonuclease BglII